MLLADEPTGNLDPATSLEIVQLLSRISERGTTVLISTHDQPIVNAMRKRVISLRHGEISVMLTVVYMKWKHRHENINRKQ